MKWWTVAVLIVFMFAWGIFYILPHDRIMRETEACLIASPKQDASTWKGCWDLASDAQGWPFKRQGRPRRM